MLKHICPALSESTEVLEAIDGELEYINNLPACRADMKDHGVAGQLVTLRALGIKADEAWYSNHGEEESLNIIRKIAATAVRALILYGCPRRGEPLQLIVNGKSYPGGGNTPVVSEDAVRRHTVPLEHPTHADREC